MKLIPFVLTSTSLTVLIWLLASFTMTAEPSGYLLGPFTPLAEGTEWPVPPDHPDAHRLGAEILGEPPPLPTDEERSPISEDQAIILNLAAE